MKRTVTQWTNIQYALRRMNPADKYVLLDSYIEQRTDGKQWSANVAIGLHARESKLVEEAEAWLLANPDA